MSEKPILFSGPMVRAILSGAKTQTRRAVKGNPVEMVRLMRKMKALDGYDEPTGEYGFCSTHARVINKHVRCPYGIPGDRLWVREAWGVAPLFDEAFDAARKGIELPGKLIRRPASSWHDLILYRGDGCLFARSQKWRPSIHMPRWASRITLDVTDVRVQRLQDISEEDAKAEGVERLKSGRGYYSAKHGKAAVHFGVYHDYASEAFADLWDTINGDGAWEANPWVYAISFASAPRPDEERSDTAAHLAKAPA